MSALCTFSRFLDDPELLQPWFEGPSWSNWRVVLKGMFAEAMSEAEQQTFREIAERDPPKNRVREAWLAIGRRAGKDSIASAVATYTAAACDFSGHLRPGEKAVILCLAVSREQAQIVFAYVRAYFETVELLKPLVQRVTQDTIELEHVDITVATCNYRSIRGKTVALCIMDEVAFWREEGGAFVSPDTEVYAALRPALATLRKLAR